MLVLAKMKELHREGIAIRTVNFPFCFQPQSSHFIFHAAFIPFVSSLYLSPTIRCNNISSIPHPEQITILKPHANFLLFVHTFRCFQKRLCCFKTNAYLIPRSVCLGRVVSRDKNKLPKIVLVRVLLGCVVKMSIDLSASPQLQLISDSVSFCCSDIESMWVLQTSMLM